MDTRVSNASFPGEQIKFLIGTLAGDIRTAIQGYLEVSCEILAALARPAEVVTGCGDQGVYDVAFGARGIVAVRAVV